MIKAVAWYSWREIIPRRWSIAFSGSLWMALISGILLGRWGSLVVPSTTTVGTVSAAFLTYAAIALGFSLAGLTLALTLPNAEFINLLCGEKPAKNKNNAYSDLLFVFSWTAIVHWVLVVVSIILVLFVNPSRPAFESGHRIKAGLVTGLGAYCLLQFLTTLVSLSQVGTVYIEHLQGHLKPRPPASPSVSKHAE